MRENVLLSEALPGFVPDLLSPCLSGPRKGKTCLFHTRIVILYSLCFPDLIYVRNIEDGEIIEDI